MGNYENLKQSITEVIRTNGNQEITGAVLQSTLLTIISTVGANATFAGIATPTTNPGTPDGPVFYLASESGTYTNFNAIELQDGLSILMWNGSWSSQQILSIDDEPTAGSDNLVKSGGVSDIVLGRFILSSSFAGLRFNTSDGYVSNYSGSGYEGFLYKVLSGEDYNFINISPALGKACFFVTKPVDGSQGLVVDIINDKVTVPSGYNYMLVDVAPTVNSSECFIYISSQLSKYVFESKDWIENQGRSIQAKVEKTSGYKAGLKFDAVSGAISSYSGSGYNGIAIPVAPNTQYRIIGLSSIAFNKVCFFNEAPAIGMTGTLTSVSDFTTESTNDAQYMLIDVDNAVDASTVFITEAYGLYDNQNRQCVVRYTRDDFPGYGSWLNDGHVYDSGAQTFHSDLIPLIGAKRVTIRSAMSTAYPVYNILNSSFGIITSVAPVDANVRAYTINTDSSMAYLEVNCFSERLGNAYQSFYIEIEYNSPTEKYVPKRIMCYGDSLTRGLAGNPTYTYPWYLQTLLGSSYQSENRGVGGENAAEICARINSFPIVVPTAFTLPSGTSSVSLGDNLICMYENKAVNVLKSSLKELFSVNYCWVKGIKCYLDYSNNEYLISRLTPGDEMVVPAGTPIYCGDKERYTNTKASVLFIGSNGGYTSVEELADMIEKSGEYLGIPYIVLNFWDKTHMPSGTGYTDIQTEYRKRFGGRFLDIVLYMSTAAIYDAIEQGLLEITEPTQRDLENMARSYPPASLLNNDGLHLNTAGNIVLAQQVYATLKSNGMIQ